MGIEQKIIERYESIRKSSALLFMEESLKKDKSVLLSVIILLALVLSAVFADFTPRPYYEIRPAERLKPPGGESILGTDQLGRDMFSRLLAGSRVVIFVLSTTLLFSTIAGSVLGIISGFFGGIVDEIIMRFTDMMLNFPPIFLAFAIISVLGIGLNNAIIAISLALTWPYARFVRGEVLRTRELLFVDGAKAIGAGKARIMFRHILPNITSPLIVQATFNVGLSIIQVAALSFIGLGEQPPGACWGLMIAEGRLFIYAAPHIIFFPGLCLFAVVLAFNILGETLRDAFAAERAVIRL